MDEPIDHHYLSIFYLSRWTSDDGCVCRFSRPYGKEVKAKRVVPKGTAFEPRLYETRGLPPGRAQTMEKDFMAMLDDEAADALSLLESGLPDKEWTVRSRSGWSRFIIAQMLRNPEDISQLKSSVMQVWKKSSRDLEETYVIQRTESDPHTLDEYLERQNPGQADEFVFRIAQNLMDHSGIGQIINNMHWLVLDVPKEGYPLLTSDRPIRMSATLAEDDTFIMMPIGPRKLFTAVIDPTTQQRIKAHLKGGLVKGINKLVVQYSVKYVYGLTDDMLPFVQNHMATRRYSTWLERLATLHGNKVVLPDSPVAKG